MLSFQDLSSQPNTHGTYYSTPSGITAYNTLSYNTTEANSKLRMRKAFTVNNFATYITGADGGTLNSRKNGANGNITANLNVDSAQLVQDITHSDNLAVGDDFEWQFSDTDMNYSYDFYSASYVQVADTDAICTISSVSSIIWLGDLEISVTLGVLLLLTHVNPGSGIYSLTRFRSCDVHSLTESLTYVTQARSDCLCHARYTGYARYVS
jgi:hypothetical protein